MKDLQNRTYYCDTFQEVHAPEALAGKVMNMTNHQKNKSNFSKKLTVAVASFAALFIASSAITYAATGNTWIRGFFKDITRPDGAVTGTEYISMDSEIRISTSDLITDDESVTIPITIQFMTPGAIPFKFLEELALGTFTLTDNEGKVIPLPAPPSEPSYSKIISGSVQINLMIDADLLQPDTTYTLHIKSLYGSKKADAPLLLKGNWSCPIK